MKFGRNVTKEENENEQEDPLGGYGTKMEKMKGNLTTR